MINIKNIRSKIGPKSVLIASILVLLVIGIPIWLHNRGQQANIEKTVTKKTWYTCTMHPSVREDHPGNCPICGMKLVPLTNEEHHPADNHSVTMSEEAVALANVQTEVVGTGEGAQEVRLFGKIEPNEQQEQIQSAYVSGRIEKLYINAVGDRVAKGQSLAIIYSPELYAAEQELVSALSFPAGPQHKALIDAAIEKLRLLNVTQSQINEVVRNKKASPYVTLKANTAGTVVEKRIATGDYVSQGQPLLKIADFSTVWVMFEAYEKDLPLIHTGSVINFTAEAIPGKTFSGKVRFINPVLDPNTRTVGVRLVMNNAGGLFKPEMIVSGQAMVNMSRNVSQIVIPKSAVLWTGKRSVVYVKDSSKQVATYELRQVTLGESLSDSYVIIDGLAQGEEIVTNGAFAVDASAQLAGKKSMMNQGD